MNQQIDIHKVGGVIVKDRRFLTTRSRGKEIFIAPGGKIEAGETAMQALARELMEEVQIDISANATEMIGTFTAKAAGNESKIVEMEVHLIEGAVGEPIPTSEVEEIKWINTQTEDVSIGSIFEHDVMPILKQRGLID